MRATETAEHARPIDELGTDRPSRRDMVDVDELAASMALEGLRHPVLVMPSGELLKGARRIAAARRLGWSSIPQKQVATVEDAVETIIAQRDESCRDRRVEEWVELGQTIELLDRRERPDRRDRTYDTFQVVGPAVTRSGATYKRGRYVVRAARSQHQPQHVVAVAQDAVRQIDAGTMLVTTAYDRVRAAEKADPVDGLGADGLPLIPPPLGSARSPKARMLRMDWIKALAAKGATTSQIAEKLGLGLSGVKKIVSDMGLVVHADQVLNKQQRKAADPNRAVKVAVADLDALVWSLDRVDPAELDPVSATVWAEQLNEYARSIRLVSRKIAKEHVR